MKKKKDANWERHLGKLAKESQKPPKTETTKTSIRVPVPLWDRVRVLAIRRHVDTQDLVLEALTQLLEGEDL